MAKKDFSTNSNDLLELQLLRILDRMERYLIELAADRKNAAREFSEQKKQLEAQRAVTLKDIEDLRLGIQKLPMPELANDQLEVGEDST